MLSPDKRQYYMGIALAVREKANCLGRKVGAVLVRENRIIATGYNGTPEGMPNCLDGGCLRCSRRDLFPSGEGYDVCICVHAEQNALLSAARFGIAVQEAAIFTTLKPCFGCVKELYQAGVRELYYLHDWTPAKPEQRAQHESLLDHFVTVHVPTLDPRDAWANARPDRASAEAIAEAIDELGHESQ